MKNETDQINIAFFQRDHQLLSNEAMLHRRNLMVFSATSLFLYLINIYYIIHLKKPLVFSSFFGVSLVKENYVPASIIILALVTIILYELLMFRFHFKISLTAYTDKFNTDKSVWKDSLSDITREIDLSIKEKLSFISQEISKIEECLREQNRVLEEIYNAKLKITEIKYSFLTDVYQKVNLLNSNVFDIEKLLIEEKIHVAPLDDKLHNLRMNIRSLYNYDAQYNLVNLPYFLREEFYTEVLNINNELYKIVQNKNMDIITEYEIREINRLIIEKNQSTKSLINNIIEISYDVKQQKFVEYILPTIVGSSSLLLGLVLIVLNHLK
ncbi:hypothetical protein [Shewanella algae]|uniref:hypothetical protein n=1 Tax=Shewanella algae TaxID=38313 RepID=UPI003005B010